MIAGQYLELLKTKREKLLDLTRSLSDEQYNFIPLGFNNNVIWNMGHVLAVSERKLHDEIGLNTPYDQMTLAKFNRGTIPEKTMLAGEIRSIRRIMQDSIKNIEKVERIIGVQKRQNDPTLEATLKFLVFHEEYHYQTVATLISYLQFPQHYDFFKL